MNLIKISATFFITLILNGTAVARESVVIASNPDRFKVEVFAHKDKQIRPAVIILSGSRGFESSSYDDIAHRFVDAGIDVYLAHLLSSQDLRQITALKDAHGRREY